MGEQSGANHECSRCQGFLEEIRRLEQLVLTDHLTDLPNRRAFEKSLEDALCQRKKISEPFSIAALDVDFFKRINDNGGHPAGDRVLKSLARLLIGIKREADFVARWGGEEFMILFHNTPLNKARMLLESFRVQISQEIGAIQSGVWIPVTVSIGVGEIAGNESLNELIDRVDLALYRAKDKGKNCVVCAH